MSKEATKKSWQKWLKVINGGTEKGADDCALCKEYRCCIGCPIAKVSGGDDCRKTPYHEWLDNSDKLISHVRARSGSCESLKAATRMAQFIRKVYLETFGEPIEPIRLRGEKYVRN